MFVTTCTVVRTIAFIYFRAFACTHDEGAPCKRDPSKDREGVYSRGVVLAGAIAALVREFQTPGAVQDRHPRPAAEQPQQQCDAGPSAAAPTRFREDETRL